MSSANIISLNFDAALVISLIEILNNSGAITKPCGMSHETL